MLTMSSEWFIVLQLNTSKSRMTYFELLKIRYIKTDVDCKSQTIHEFYRTTMFIVRTLMHQNNLKRN